MKKRTQTELAAIWRTTTRTIRAWQRLGAPLNDAPKMRAWLAARKSIPPGTRSLLNQQAQELRVQDASAIPAGAPLPLGAAHALKRLEQAEADAFRALQQAQLTGDPYEVKTTREQWLRTSEALRRADLALEQDRRESGELLPRKNVEAALVYVAMFLRYSIRQTALQVADKVLAADGSISARRVIEDSLFAQLTTILACYKAAASRELLAPGFLEVFCRDMDQLFVGMTAMVDAQAPLLAQAFNSSLAGALALFAERDAARNAPPPQAPAPSPSTNTQTQTEP